MKPIGAGVRKPSTVRDLAQLHGGFTFIELYEMTKKMIGNHPTNLWPLLAAIPLYKLQYDIIYSHIMSYI